MIPLVGKTARAATTFLTPLLVAALPAWALTIEDAGRSFRDEGFGWLMSPSILGTGEAVADRSALDEVARLFRTGDGRAPLALKNYMDRFPNDAGAFDLAGIVLMQQQDFANAAISFRKGLVLDYANPWLRAKFGTARILAGDREGGRAELEKVLDRQPDNPLALRYLAKLAHDEENLPQAILYSERALRAFGLPRDTVNQAHFDLAELYLRAHRNRDVLDLLGPAVRNDALEASEAFRRELYGRYLDAAMQAGEAEAARNAMTRLQPLIEPDSPSVRLTRARLARLEGRTAEALKSLDALMVAAPELAAALRPDRAQMLAADGRTGEAVTLWLEIAADEPGDGDIPYLREALATEIAAGRTAQAAERAGALAAAHPERDEIRLLEVEMLGKAGRADRALERAAVLVRDFPDSADAHFLHGTLAAATGDAETGRIALERSLEIAPDRPHVWLTLSGVIHGHGDYVHGTDSGDHGDVEALLRRAIDANPREADLRAELGLLYLSDGRPEDAIGAFDAALVNEPGHVAGLSLGALARADLGRDLGTAMELMDRAYVMAPDDPISQDILGWILARAGDPEEGLRYMEKAAAAAPDDVTIQYHLGVTRLELGETEAARPHLLAALSGPSYDHNVADARARYIAAWPAREVTAEVRAIDGVGVHESLGGITIRQTDAGLEFSADLQGLPEGRHAAHVHLHATCAPSPDGKAGGLAGGHYGHSRGHDHDAGPDRAVMDHAAMGHTDAGTAQTGHTGTGDADTGQAGTGQPRMDRAAMDPGGNDGDEAALPTGDLPGFVADPEGRSTTVFVHAPLTLDEVRARSLMIHEGPDENGVSGRKIACAVIP